MEDNNAFGDVRNSNYELTDFGGMFLTSAPHFCDGRTYPGLSGYVQWFKPVKPRPISVTLIHGGGGQGSEFLTTPDGRPGWVHDFLRAGFTVFVLDRPGHGRNSWNSEVLGPHTPYPDYETLYPRFVEPKASSLWSEAINHNQWPDHDPVAGDRFMASQGVMATNLVSAQKHVEVIAPQLFEITGDTILVSHSAGGPCGWALAAMGGPRVKAVAAVEPLGYPGLEHPLGVFENGLCVSQFSGLHDPYQRPIAFVTGQATWMRGANLRASKYLQEQNYNVTHFLLEEYGIWGNGHMLISEKNSSDIAKLIISWLDKEVGSTL
ncbi:alpha/beta fold hydrolase [Pseudomonas sp. EGD-AK9]|uniref:alpha/beta fold hydrolase n=1 Tax=Pseudomonas sp. EGD-AK9 TaxID=1386078 RepID=UPI0009EC6346|nr:alpha/beta fold hydrolase [Pseudomonas sp. EGD-AK9]